MLIDYRVHNRLLTSFVDAPVYLSYPHFYQADPVLLQHFEGLNPQKEKHENYFLIQPVSTFESYASKHYHESISFRG